MDPSDSAGARRGAWVPGAVLVGAAGLAAAFHLHTGYVNDDALITVRYAENLARGEGLVYNPGERVLGTTTPLWALILAGASALGLNATSVAVWLGIAAHGAAAALTTVFFRRRGAPLLAQAAAGALVGALPLLVTFAGSGMETAAYVALLAALLVLFESESWVAFGFVAGAAVLTRPDAGLPLAAAGVLATVRARSLRPALRALPGFAVVVVPWIVGAGLYYGSPLPNSGFAKRMQVEDWGPYSELLRRELWTAGPALSFAIVGVAAAAATASAPARLLPLAAFAAIAVGMHLGGLPGCRWYAPPAIYLVAVLAADGAATLAAAVASSTVASMRRLGPAVLAAPLAAAAILPSEAHATRTMQANMDACHVKAGTWLRDHAAPGVSVGVDNIGYIGHISGLRIVDMLGLVQRDTAEAIGRGERDYALRHHRPEMIAVWARRGNTWKYMPDAQWLEAQGYRTVFEALLFPHYPSGPAYAVWSRVPLRNQ